MTAGIVVSLVLVAVAAVFVAAPLLRHDAQEIERKSSVLSRSRELHSRREMLLAALKDLEDDRATDKIDDGDYRELKNKLSNEAIQVMRELDEHEAQAVEPGTVRFPRLAGKSTSPDERGPGLE